MKKYLALLMLILFGVFCGNNTTASRVTVISQDESDVIAAHNNLSYTDITFQNTDDKNSVTMDIMLPLTGTNNTTITWSSDQPNIIINNDLGSVTRPLFSEGDKLVILTATITKGTASLGKQFILIVKETPPASGNTIQYLVSVSFVMVYVEPKSFFTGMDDTGVSSVSKGYFIGQKEVTYLQWLEVQIWAEAHGYTFVNVGVMGDGTGDNNRHPVSTVNWRDALIWTNALTEYYNAQKGTNYKCVYTSDASFNSCLRTSSSSMTIDTTPGSIDNPFVNPNARGFRLPTNAEWALAARYISDTNNDGDIMDAGEYYPGSHISGDTSGDYLTSSIFGNYAWCFVNSGDSTHEVGLKLPNALGLYDMTGNIMEWNFDWDSNNINVYRIYRGGSWNLTTMNLRVGKNYFNEPRFASHVIGFRLAQNY